MTDAQIDTAVGLVRPWWIEDWNHRSREQVGGALGYTRIGMTYFAQLDYVDTHLPTRRRPGWQVVRRSDVTIGTNTDDGGDDRYILMPEAVRTTIPAASSRAELKTELARHVRDVLVNGYGEEEETVERLVLRMIEQLLPSPLVVNEKRLDGWRTDELPHVTAVGAMDDQGRLISVVIDKAIASSLSLQLVDCPTSLT